MVTKSSFRIEFGLILVGAVIFTASFLWKDFLSDVEEKYFPKSNGLGGRFLFVVIITILLVTFAVYLKDVFKLSTNGKKTSNIFNFDDDPNDDLTKPTNLDSDISDMYYTSNNDNGNDQLLTNDD